LAQAAAVIALFAPILAEKERLERNRDMWKSQSERQAQALHDLRMQMLADEGQHRDALAAEREQLAVLVEDACAIPPAVFAGMELEAFHRGADAMNNAVAAAIRAQGPA
jgi:hypothetical protein